jgi:hypothetical protein
VDRTSASSSINSGLVWGAIALAVFGLAFLVAIIYIG